VEAADSSVTFVITYLATRHNIMEESNLVLTHFSRSEFKASSWAFETDIHFIAILQSLYLWTRDSQLMKFCLENSVLWMVISYRHCLQFHESDWQSQLTVSERRLSLWEWRKRFRIVGETLYIFSNVTNKQVNKMFEAPVVLIPHLNCKIHTRCHSVLF
jgi:hypothetical protein